MSRLSLALQACWREPTRLSILCGYPGASDRRLPRTFSEAFISQEEREGLRLSVVLRILTGHPKQREHKVDGLDSNLRMPGRERGSSPAWACQTLVHRLGRRQSGRNATVLQKSHKSLFSQLTIGLACCGVLEVFPLWLMEDVSSQANRL